MWKIQRQKLVNNFPGTGEIPDIALRLEAIVISGVIVYRFSNPLFFANSGYYRARTEELVESSP